MCVANLFGGSKSPPPLPAPIAPPPVVDNSKDNAASSKARDDEAKRALLSKGRDSTILTSPLGVKDPAQVEKKKLLGY
jgi:hypothetical protein